MVKTIKINYMSSKGMISKELINNLLSEK
jgi:hypothetical protein